MESAVTPIAEVAGKVALCRAILDLGRTGDVVSGCEEVGKRKSEDVMSSSPQVSVPHVRLKSARKQIHAGNRWHSADARRPQL